MSVDSEVCYDEIFWDSWLKHEKAVFNNCLNFTKNRHHDAQDLLSEVMVKAYKKTDLTKSNKSILYWFLQLAKNSSIDKYRRELRLIHLADMEIILEGNRATPSLSPSHNLLKSELQLIIQNSIRELSS